MLRCLLLRATGSSSSASGLLESGATATRSALSSFGTGATTFSSSSTSSSTSSSASTPPSKLAQTSLSPLEDEPGQVRIDAYDASSFELSIAGKVPGSTRRKKVSGPLVLSAPGGFVAKWKVGTPRAAASPASAASAAPATSIASIVALVSPRPDIVLVGTGRAGSRASPARASAEISEAAGGAAVEFFPTSQAASLYNVLSQEGRSVVAAMLPAGEDGS